MKNDDFVCEPFFGVELSDSVNDICSVDVDLYICGECEFDNEFDSEMTNYQYEGYDFNQWEITHMSREASSHPTDETGTFGESNHVSIDYIDVLIMVDFKDIFDKCRRVNLAWSHSKLLPTG